MRSHRLPIVSTPGPAPQRIAALDALRGFALLGIFIMNMPAFAHSIFAVPHVQDLGSLQSAAAWLRDLLFAGKFNLLFGFAFGVGFTLQLERLEAAVPARAADLYRRRLVVLMAIGLLHTALLWMGDILVAYAICGFVLLAIRRRGGGTVLVIVAIGLLVPALLDGVAARATTAGELVQWRAESGAIAARQDRAYGAGSFSDAAAETLRMFAWVYASAQGWVTTIAAVIQLGTGIAVGFWVGRRGWLLLLPELAAPIRRAQLAALAIALACGAASWTHGTAFATSEQVVGFAPALVRSIGRAALSSFYALTVFRLASTGSARTTLRLLAVAGRMPLSNYLLQTVLAILLFHAWALGLWNRTGPIEETLLAIVLFAAVQLPLSAWWQSRFRFGPVEWLWRRLTYGAVRT